MPGMEINRDTLLTTLKHNFGYDSFRELQEDIIHNTLQKKDSVILMPTGGGKSICYQLPALLLEGTAIVISPLISLMKDQVQALNQNGIPAAFINSSLSPAETREVFQKLDNNEYRLLYLSPERIFSGNMISDLIEKRISLIAIDEAHCVSSWGHSFRPVYRRLNALKEVFPDVPVLALTATADRSVRSEIGDLLGLAEPKHFIRSFDRPNISLKVLPGKDRFKQILSVVIQHNDESGIIYCTSRKSCENLAQKLRAKGVSARAYHAGMKSEEREDVQNEFISDKTPVICATIAFGMGIDKPDVRFVIHYNMPGNLESYYQEIGRAGRDGQDSEAILFYSYRDVQTQLNFMNELSNETYRKVQEAKLKRMQDYAESPVCRRKVLLSYFSEQLQESCGNCDVCKDPPEFFDGTIHTQKALSAIKRCNEQLSSGVLIDLLRGNYSSEIKQSGFNNIRTFGVGKDSSPLAWQLYIQQMIHSSIIEPDYRDGFKLKLTPLANEILFENRQVELISVDTIKKRQERQKEIPADIPLNSKFNPALYEELKALRKRLAQESEVPAYMIFSDAALKDMAQRIPHSQLEFKMVKGVGDHKAELYAEIFLELTRKCSKPHS